MLQIWHFHLERENDSICDFKSNVCWIVYNCFFKVHSCTVVHISSAWTQATPDLSLIKHHSSLCLSFIPHHSSVWRISCCSQPWDWIESFCLTLFPSSTSEEEDRSGRSHNEHFSIHFIYQETPMVILNWNFRYEICNSYYKTAIMGCHVWLLCQYIIMLLYLDIWAIKIYLNNVYVIAHMEIMWWL